MIVGRLFSRRALGLATNPAAWQAAIAQQAWRVQGACAPPCNTDPLTDPLTIYWPVHYQHFNATHFVGPLHSGLAALTTVEPRQIAQPYEGIVLFEVRHRHATFPVAVDYFDVPSINRDCLKHAALYFKMQFLRSGYAAPNVLPGGYVAGKSSLYEHYGRLRRLREKPFRFDVYGRFGLRFSADIRCRAVKLLRDAQQFQYTGGTGLALYMQSLREAARARICIDLPGQGPFCYRLVEYLAMGCCIIAPRHAGAMHVELRDREHIIYCRDDLADLEALCVYYLAHAHARETIARNAATFFDEHLYPTRLARYYLRSLIQGISANNCGQHAGGSTPLDTHRAVEC